MRIRIFDDRGEYIATLDGTTEEAEQRIAAGGFAYFHDRYWLQEATRKTVLCPECMGRGCVSGFDCHFCQGMSHIEKTHYQLKPLDADDPRVNGLYSKAIKAESEKPSKKCPCGREMEYVYANGSWISLYRVWDGGKSFGSLTYASCCKRCEEQQNKRFAEEYPGSYGY